jgi:hypothetical protein
MRSHRGQQGRKMNRQVQTVFCDDIRHELGGKLSYIGVYSGWKKKTPGKPGV